MRVYMYFVVITLQYSVPYYIYYICNLLIFKHLHIGMYIYAHFLFYAAYLCSVFY